jgi:hypothetical protein
MLRESGKLVNLRMENEMRPFHYVFILAALWKDWQTL